MKIENLRSGGESDLACGANEAGCCAFVRNLLLPSAVGDSKFYLVDFWIFLGGFGWLALIFALQLGGRRDPGIVVLQNLIAGLLLLDSFATLLPMAFQVLRRTGVGWRFIVFFDVLPYLLFAARVSWLCVRRQPGGHSGSSKIKFIRP